jgi:hypothetical protein
MSSSLMNGQLRVVVLHPVVAPVASRARKSFPCPMRDATPRTYERDGDVSHPFSRAVEIPRSKDHADR